jgi:hypothetical protein
VTSRAPASPPAKAGNQAAVKLPARRQARAAAKGQARTAVKVRAKARDKVPVKAAAKAAAKARVRAVARGRLRAAVKAQVRVQVKGRVRAPAKARVRVADPARAARAILEGRAKVKVAVSGPPVRAPLAGQTPPRPASERKAATTDPATHPPATKRAGTISCMPRRGDWHPMASQSSSQAASGRAVGRAARLSAGPSARHVKPLYPTTAPTAHTPRRQVSPFPGVRSRLGCAITFASTSLN